MTIAERNNKLKHFITCLKCEVSGKPCKGDECPVQYKAGNMGEIIENLEAISKVLEHSDNQKTMTNGEKVLADFPNATTKIFKNRGFTYIEVEQDDKWIADFNIEWWNSEYKS